MSDEQYRAARARDYNRAARNSSAKENLDAWPRQLRWAYWVLVVSAVIMLVSGMVGIFGSGGPQVEPQNAQVAEYLHSIACLSR